MELKIGSGFEFPTQEFFVSKEDQKFKLACCGIDPDLYGEEVDITMLGLPTLRVLMACSIPILGSVHLWQRFRQLKPFKFGERILASGKVLRVEPHPRGCILTCDFTYMDSRGEIRIEARRSGISPIGPREPSQDITRPEEDLEGFSEIMRRVLEPEKVADFSSEAGNLIHSDPKVAREHGFRAPIAAGLMAIHFYREALARYQDSTDFDLEVWFRRPMFWDDTLSLVAKKRQGKIESMHLLGSDGKPTSNCILHLG
tara:strand:+ start:2947 stop:3717 length:771 start_codon:yes stop_codon:yes gene_type:complete